MSALDLLLLLGGILAAYALGRWDGRNVGEYWAYDILSRRWKEAETSEAREALRQAQSEIARLDSEEGAS